MTVPRPSSTARADGTDPPVGTVRRSELIGAVSYALDLTEGQPLGHCLRCCHIGMTLTRSLRLTTPERLDLYYTILLKDAGCSSNAARLWELYGSDERSIKQDFKTVDSQHLLPLAKFVFRHAGTGESLDQKLKRILFLSRYGETLATELVQTRCERGADIARQLGFGEAVATGIYCLDEHWNGKGKPQGLAKTKIPLGAQVALLSQVIDVFHGLGGPERALHEVTGRSGTWFDPELVSTFIAESRDPAFWAGLAEEGLEQRVQSLEPEGTVLFIDDPLLDRIANVFARIIDVKSPYTHGHSRRVAQFGEVVATRMGLPEETTKWIRRGALLHDLGKLAISNAVLEKPGRLTPEEWQEVQRHPYYTEMILKKIRIFGWLSKVAGNHHERLDGTGYPHSLASDNILLETRIITAVDIFDALTAPRPYRGPIPVNEALEIMEREINTAIDDRCFTVLKDAIPHFAFDAEGTPDGLH